MLSILLSGVFSSILTLVVTFILQKRRDAKEYKMQLFKDILAYRTDLLSGVVPTGNLQKALNQIFVAYNRDKAVIQAFENLRKSVLYKKGKEDNDKILSDLIGLIKAMADNLHIDYSFSNDDLFTRPLTLSTPS